MSSPSDSTGSPNTGEIEDELQTLRQRVAFLSQDKKAFFDCLSTELRTPLDSIQILSRLLEENPDSNLTPKQVEYASVIYRSSASLLQLINELLVISATA